MAGIKDIANRADVSISTVSYALNGSSRVSEETRKKILAIADEMNYIPNMAGQNLRRKRTNIIAVYLTTYQGTFYGDLLDGMQIKAKELGLELIVCSGERSRLFLPQRMIDGILVIDFTYPDEQLLDYADSGNVIVVLDRQLQHENITSVLLDNQTGTKEVMESFAEEGIHDVFIITGPKDNLDSEERLKVAIETAENLGYNYQMIDGEFTEESGLHAARQMEPDWSNPIGVFALNDEMAIGVQNYFKDRGIAIGEELIVRGFDNIKAGQYLTPPLESVAYSKHKWGAEAVEVLSQMIQGKEVNNVLIPTYFSRK